MNYYQHATDLYRLSYVRYVMQTALLKTLAHKHKTTVTKMSRKYSSTVQIDGRRYKVLQVEVPTRKGSRIIQWGGIPLRTVKFGTGRLDDNRYVTYEYRSDLVQRLQADECELCGSKQNCEVHHVRKLKDLQKRWAGRPMKPMWVQRMIAMTRKTLVVCYDCHRKIHQGFPTPNKSE